MAASGTTKKITSNQILGAGGTATLASATITGDLTVDTSTLKVDSANKRVGVNNASPAQALDVAGSVYLSTNATYIYGKTSGGSATRTFGINAANDVYIGSIDQSISNIRFNSGGGDWATLNSTGLGVGVSPTTKLDVLGSGDGELRVRAASDAALIFSETTANKNWKLKPSGGDFYFQYSATAYNSGYSSLLTLTSTGNVGVGVTPSAGGSVYYKTLELGKAGCGLFATTAALTGSELTYLSGNGVLAYNAGPEWKYGNNGAAAIYGIEDGVHNWYNATSGTAGVVFVPTQAMTLDASGNLLVAGTSAYIRAGGRTQILGGSVVDINTAGNNVGIAFGGASSILPCDGSSATTDGVANFGSASKRWNTIYASTGTINTSDQNEKQDIADLGDAEKRVAGKIKSLVKKYRFKDAVASKGENARIHVGWIAQDIQNAFSSEGLDASKYGVFCSDTWEENGVQKTRLGLRYDEVLAFVVSAI
jgi:hypothetical protein